MSTVAAIFFGFLGVFLYAFTLWRQLRDDYPTDQIFSLTLLSLVSVWMSLQFSFWLFFLATFGLLFYFVKRFSWRFFELIDAWAPAWFSLASFFFLTRFAIGHSLMHLAQALISFLSLLLYTFLARRFRHFFWYPSGRVGFAGLGSLACYFGLRLGVAIFSFFMLSLKAADILPNLLALTLLLVVLYLRSGRQRAEAWLVRLRRQT